LNQSTRSFLRACLSILFGIFCLPAFGFGGYLLYCWFRIHTSDVYYTNYWYVTVALIFLGTGLLSLCATWFGAWRRSFHGALFLVPVLLGLAAMSFIPNMLPRGNSMMADTNYLSDVQSFFRVWYEEKHQFPANEAEFREALAKGPAAWQYRVGPASSSEYRKGGKPIPYEIDVENGALGPRLSNTSQRPGVIYYCVSQDLQEFWVTMTALQKDFGSGSSIRGVPGRPNGEVWLIHAAGKDYPVKAK
jgi:hypothetical protein